MLRPLADHFPTSVQGAPRSAAFVFLALSIAATLISIALSQIFLAASLAAAAWIQVREKGYLALRLPITLPLVLFFGWTVVSALASSDVGLGLTIVKKFFIFLLLFLVPSVASRLDSARWIYHSIFAAAGLSSAMGLAQYMLNPNRDLLNRISGFMGQWMTYSGLQMLVAVALVSYALSVGWRRRWWVLPLGLMLFGSLFLSYTRNAWLGTVAGLLLVLLLRSPRSVLLLAAMLAALLLLSPGRIQERLRMGLDPDDTTTRGRIELVETSIRLIRDNPWFGVGPKNVNTEALRYRGTDEFPDWLYQHMHNNFLQIAAERGIPGLLLWLWFMGRLFWDAARLYRAARLTPQSEAGNGDRADMLLVSITALGAGAALLVSGMFEYNFGDSEVLTLFLFVMSAPYAGLSRQSGGHIDEVRRA